MTKPGYIVLPDDGEDPWRAMRKRRASPSITGDARVTTLRTALEQAEQQFKAAASVGPESRPLNVFYGLSQAGRAIAAAAQSLTKQDWLLKGHGIHTEGMDTAATIADVKVVPESGLKSSFGRLSSVLGSAIPTCTLGDIWTRIWDAAAFEPLQPSRTDIPLAVSPVRSPAAPGVTWPDGRIDVYVTLPAAFDRTTTWDEFVDLYPQVAGAMSETGHARAGLDWPNPGDTSLVLHWHGNTDAELATIRARFADYKGYRIAVPVFAERTQPPHPLMLWWAALHALSMLARYQPDRWTEFIDVDRTESAVAVEYLLNAAVQVVPRLINQAFDEV